MSADTDSLIESIQAITSILLIPTVLFFVFFAISVCCGKNGLSELFKSTLTVRGEPYGLIIWFIWGFSALAIDASFCLRPKFWSEYNSYLVVGLLIGNISSFGWCMLVCEQAREQSKGLTWRRTASLFLHRLLLFAWGISVVIVCVAVYGATVLFEKFLIFVWVGFVLFQTVIWELFLIRWIVHTKDDDEYPGF